MNAVIKNNVGIILSKREQEILKYIADGHSNAEIALKLLISKKTVEANKIKLLAKTNSKNSAHLIMQAAINNLIEI